ncbi:hypothetical protein ACLOJK_014030 [Asimina triloba]
MDWCGSSTPRTPEYRTCAQMVNYTLKWMVPELGGAERLIVDAAVQLSSHGHDVHVFTAHHDRNRCFEETVSGPFPITVYGDFIPRHVFYHFHAVCAYLRCIFVALCVLLMWPTFDVILADQVSVVIPLMKLKKSTKVVFYCHFPDSLLATRTTKLRRLYRAPIDSVEEATTGMADLILVNSRFTASTFAKTFKRLNSQGIQPAVLYPAVNVEQFDGPRAYKVSGFLFEDLRSAGLRHLLSHVKFSIHQWGKMFFPSLSGMLNFLSVNRFERKKNIDLAVRAFALLRAFERDILQDLNLTEVTLTLAGGYDKRLKENVEYLDELKSLAQSEGVFDRIRFSATTIPPPITHCTWMIHVLDMTDMPPLVICILGPLWCVADCSCAILSDILKELKLKMATMQDEHFGIVPLEAMAAQKPVIACNSGGPMETIRHEITGFLCDPTPHEFSQVMARLISDTKMAEGMGKEARRHVSELFCTQVFGQRLNGFVTDLANKKSD